MDPNLYSQVAAQAAVRYQTLLGTLRSLLIAVQFQPFSPATSRTLRNNAMSVVNAFLSIEHNHIALALETTALDALRCSRSDLSASLDTEVPAEFEAYLTQSGDYLEGEIRNQANRDVETLIKRFGQVAIESSMANHHRGWLNTRTALEQMRFQFKDRAGRLYPAQSFIASAWRHSLVVLAAEFYVLQSSALGATRFEVVNPNPASKWAGYVIDLTVPSAFTDVRDEIFHPNSNSTLKAL